MKDRAIHIFLVFVVLGILIPANYVLAAAVFSIQINEPESGATVTNPVKVAGSWKVADNPPGNIDAYHVQIQWGDGVTYTPLYINRTDNGLSGQNQIFYGNFSTQSILGCSASDGADNCTGSSLDHSYSSSGAFTITVKLYHAQPPGNEAGDSTASVSINIAEPVCDLTATGAPAFGPMNPDATAGDGNKTTLENIGNVDITSLTISGADWQRTGNGATIPVGQTKWALTDGQDYDSGMTALSAIAASLGITPFVPSDTQDVFFKLRVPNDQPAGDYTQQITFTFGC